MEPSVARNDAGDGAADLLGIGVYDGGSRVARRAEHP
jgi:hypothetical protein